MSWSSYAVPYLTLHSKLEASGETHYIQTLDIQTSTVKNVTRKVYTINVYQRGIANLNPCSMGLLAGL